MSNTYINFAEKAQEFESIKTFELDCLDKDSVTSINEYMLKYAEDKSFTPPEGSFVFDTDISDDISVDDEVPGMDYDFEDVYEEENARARE